MSPSHNYIVVHADERRYLSVSLSGNPQWVTDVKKASPFTQSQAVAIICRHGMSASEQRRDLVLKRLGLQQKPVKAIKKVVGTPPVILRYLEGSTIKYLYRFSSSLGGIASFTSNSNNARKFSSFEQAQQFIANTSSYDPRLKKCTPVHQNVAHVLETVVAQRPAQDSRIQQVVDQFNTQLPTLTNRDVVRVWTFLNPKSKTGLSMTVSVDSGLTKLEAWQLVRAKYGIRSSLPAAYDEYRGVEAQTALKLAMDMTVVKF